MPGKFSLNISLFDKALTKEAAEKYRLSIQLSLDGFSFCILDTNRSQYSGLEEYVFRDVSTPLDLSNTLKEILTQHEWLKRNYTRTKVVFETSKATLMPSPLFDPDHASKYLKFNHYGDFGELVRYDTLPNLGGVNIFSVPEIIVETIDQHFPDAQLHHHASPLIETLLMLNKNMTDDKRVFANVRNAYLDVFVMTGNKLVLSNSFKYSEKEDFIYYLLFIFEQLELNPENIELFLFGNIKKTSTEFDICTRYIRNVSFLKRNQGYRYSYVFDPVPDHFYYNLFSLQACEL